MLGFQENQMKALALLAISILVGCAGDDAGPPGLDQELTLAFSERVTIEAEALTLTFTEVNEDSRCPTGVQCVWAGQATITLAASNNPESVSNPLVFTIPGADTATYLSYTIQFLQLDPHPSVSHQPITSEYRATLVVTNQ